MVHNILWVLVLYPLPRDRGEYSDDCFERSLVACENTTRGQNYNTKTLWCCRSNTYLWCSHTRNCYLGASANEEMKGYDTFPIYFESHSNQGGLLNFECHNASFDHFKQPPIPMAPRPMAPYPFPGCNQTAYGGVCVFSLTHIPKILQLIHFHTSIPTILPALHFTSWARLYFFQVFNKVGRVCPAPLLYNAT